MKDEPTWQNCTPINNLRDALHTTFWLDIIKALIHYLVMHFLAVFEVDKVVNNQSFANLNNYFTKTNVEIS